MALIVISVSILKSLIDLPSALKLSPMACALFYDLIIFQGFELCIFQGEILACQRRKKLAESEPAVAKRRIYETNGLYIYIYKHNDMRVLN